METIDQTNTNERMQAIFNGIFLLSFALLGFIIVGPVLGLMLALPFLSGSMMEVTNIMIDPYSSADGKTLLYFMQAGATFGMFIMPALYSRSKHNTSYRFFSPRPTDIVGALIAMFITIAFMGVNSIFVEWNANLSFPDAFKGLEEWARSFEEQGAKMTEFLTDIGGVGELFGALLIMAILPAIAEEFVFRGLLQKYFHQGINNIHVAIWLSAILFSTIHLQFFGFVPRMLLGALFGYLYFWSGNLIIPIVAHFINNGFTLVMIYLVDQKVIDYDIQNTEAPTLATTLIFAIITLGLVYYFHRTYSKPADG